MYGINGKIDPPKKKWPSDRAEALRHIVEKNSADIFNTSDVLAASLTEEKIIISPPRLFTSVVKSLAHISYLSRADALPRTLKEEKAHSSSPSAANGTSSSLSQ